VSEPPEEWSTRFTDRALDDQCRFADGHKPRGHDHGVDQSLHLMCGGVAPDLEALGGWPAAFLGSTQTSDDALDADRCIQQYGLPGVGRSWGAGGTRGLAGVTTVRVAVSSWGSLYAAESRLPNGLTTSPGTVTRT